MSITAACTSVATISTGPTADMVGEPAGNEQCQAARARRRRKSRHGQCRKAPFGLVDGVERGRRERSGQERCGNRCQQKKRRPRRQDTNRGCAGRASVVQLFIGSFPLDRYTERSTCCYCTDLSGKVKHVPRIRSRAMDKRMNEKISSPRDRRVSACSPRPRSCSTGKGCKASASTRSSSELGWRRPRYTAISRARTISCAPT